MQRPDVECTNDDLAEIALGRLHSFRYAQEWAWHRKKDVAGVAVITGRVRVGRKEYAMDIILPSALRYLPLPLLEQWLDEELEAKFLAGGFTTGGKIWHWAFAEGLERETT